MSIACAAKYLFGAVFALAMSVAYGSVIAAALGYIGADLIVQISLITAAIGCVAGLGFLIAGQQNLPKTKNMA